MKGNLLSQVYKFIITHDDVQRKLGEFDRAMKTKDWEFLRDVILVMRSQMASEYFSKSFTSMTPEEKDITQRTYYHVNVILEFLLSPVEWVKKRGINDPSRTAGKQFNQRS